MTHIRLLAMDVDGTLVDLHDNISAPVKRALAEVRAAGVTLALATGRRYRSVLPLVDQLGLQVPLVTTNGALIKDPAAHQTLFRAQFPTEVLQGVLTLFKEWGHEPLLYTDTWDQGFDIYVRTLEGNSPQHQEFVLRNVDSLRVAEDIWLSPPAGVFACFGIGDQASMLELELELARRLPGQLYVHVLRSPKYSGYMCEISPAGVSKWSGLLYLVEKLGITVEEVCSVGDDVNDMPMIANSGVGFAMANAPAAVLAAADYVAPTVEEDGLLDVVKHVLQTLRA